MLLFETTGLWLRNSQWARVTLLLLDNSPFQQPVHIPYLFATAITQYTALLDSASKSFSPSWEAYPGSKCADPRSTSGRLGFYQPVQ